MIKIPSRAAPVVEVKDNGMAALTQAVTQTQHAIAELAATRTQKKVMVADIERDSVGKMTRVIISIE